MLPILIIPPAKRFPFVFRATDIFILSEVSNSIKEIPAVAPVPTIELTVTSAVKSPEKVWGEESSLVKLPGEPVLSGTVNTAPLPERSTVPPLSANVVQTLVFKVVSLKLSLKLEHKIGVGVGVRVGVEVGVKVGVGEGEVSPRAATTEL